MKQLFTITTCTVLFIVFMAPRVTFADEITIRPFLIDETVTPRDTKTNTVTITSDYDYRKAVLYATVNEITVDTAGEIKEFVSPVMTDRTNTVTSWIEVSRGRIEIEPGGSVDVPLTIRVHPNARPGVYHAFIGFVEAPNRPAAEKIALEGDADGVFMKVTVSDERKDSMHISSFSIDRFITGSDDRQISIEVENAGDIASAPAGEIVFYDSRGVEVTAVSINEDATMVAPGEKVTLTSEVPIDKEFGRFKANISMQYGLDQKASLHDTTFFYIVPLQLLLIVFGIILFLSISIVLLLRKVFFQQKTDDTCHDVLMYVREGHEPQPKDHDINLKNIS